MKLEIKALPGIESGTFRLYDSQKSADLQSTQSDIL